MNKKKKICGVCEAPKYCRGCGEKLDLKIKIYQYYDRDTGEKVNYHYHFWRCPDYIVFFGVFSGHDSLDDIPSGGF